MKLYAKTCVTPVSTHGKPQIVKSLSNAIQRDKYLAVAFFQRGTLYLQNKSAEKAVPDLQTALKLLRENTHIDYKPLGLYVRLTSIQVRFNLALAYAFVGKLVGAQNLLTEALHDADELQNKSLKMLQNRINVNEPELVSAMQISCNKVFTLPKDVAQNLEKKNFVGRAFVVYALNPDDRSPAFHGSKRVKVLKEKYKSQESQQKTAKRIVKNTKPRNRSTLVLNEESDQGGMKKCTSLSDVIVGSSSAVFASTSPANRIKGLFKTKHSDSSTDQSRTGVSLNCSINDFVVSTNPQAEPNEKRLPSSLLAGVRKLLGNKRKGQICESKLDEMPVLVKREVSPTEDFGKFGELCSRSQRVPSQDLSASDDDERVLKVDKDKLVVNTGLKVSTGSQSEKTGSKRNANFQHFQNHITEKNVKKQRPPPPSYPPPRLPRKIVINL